MELLAVLSKIEARGATEKVRKVRQRCGEVWKYAVVTGRAEYNPAPDLASAVTPHEKEHYAFLTQDELPEFLRTLNTYAGSVLVKIAMQLLILTGVRPGELRQAEWQEFDFERKVWNVPAERMKMRRLNRPCFPGECFVCELRLPDHHFRWKRNMPFPLLPAGYDPVVPATVGYCTSTPTSVWPVPLRRGFSSSYDVSPPLYKVR